MLPTRSRLFSAAVVIAIGLTGSAAVAQAGRWGGSRWGDSRWDGDRRGGERSFHNGDSREGKIETTRFRVEGDAALALAHGPITVVPMAADDISSEGGDVQALVPTGATYEAAVEDQLVHAGYQTATAAPAGQIAEVRVTRIEAAPPEQPRKPLSGEMSVGVSNRGSAVGLALQYDATKPRTALIATRLEARIRDKANGQVLWEGRAEIFTREGDVKWDDQAIASTLAANLFGGFPVRTGEARSAR